MVTHFLSLTSEVGPAVLLCCTLPQKSFAAFNAKGDKEAMVLHTLHPSSQNLQKVEKVSKGNSPLQRTFAGDSSQALLGMRQEELPDTNFTTG